MYREDRLNVASTVEGMWFDTTNGGQLQADWLTFRFREMARMRFQQGDIGWRTNRRDTLDKRTSQAEKVVNVKRSYHKRRKSLALLVGENSRFTAKPGKYGVVNDCSY